MVYNEGARNSSAKLSARQVREIRRKAADDCVGGPRRIGGGPQHYGGLRVIGEVPYGWISKRARSYGVSASVIYDIIRGNSWPGVGRFYYVDVRRNRA